MPTAPGDSRNPEGSQPNPAPAIDWANVASEVRIMRQLDKSPGEHPQGQEGQSTTSS